MFNAAIWPVSVLTCVTDVATCWLSDALCEVIWFAALFSVLASVCAAV